MTSIVQERYIAQLESETEFCRNQLAQVSYFKPPSPDVLDQILIPKLIIENPDPAPFIEILWKFVVDFI